MNQVHRLHDVRHRHLGWDREHQPQLHIDPGEVVELALQDCFDGQFDRTATATDVTNLDLSRTNPLTGPIAIEGVQPGMTVGIELLEITPDITGWTTILPGFGLLATDFPHAHVVTSDIATATITFGDVAELPTRPFVGTVGLTPAAPGRHDVIPPRRVGGNLDCRDVTVGSTLWLPAEVPGGLLSLGDGHGAQGDGEVCGTAVETAMSVRFRVHVRDESIAGPRLDLPSWPTNDASKAGHDTLRAPMTMGVGPDLYTGAQDATRSMIDWLGQTCGLDAADAYALCSVAGDLRIIEVVDRPNWVVGLQLQPVSVG